MTQKLKCNLGQVGNVVEKGEKCWLQAFSPNTTMFSKSFSPRGIKFKFFIVWYGLTMFIVLMHEGQTCISLLILQPLTFCH